jgi:hypothetical protein
MRFEDLTKHFELLKLEGASEGHLTSSSLAEQPLLEPWPYKILPDCIRFSLL